MTASTAFAELGYRVEDGDDGYLIQWLRFIGQEPFECDPSIIARRLLSAKATEEEKHLVAELIDKWARAYVKRFPK